MRWYGGTPATRILLAYVAVLLPAGALSATVVSQHSMMSGGVDGRVSVAGVNASALEEEPTTTSTVPVTVAQTPAVAAPAAPSTPTSTRPPASTTTTTRRAATSPTTVPLTDPNWLTVPNIAPAGTWQTQANGVSMRLRIEPSVPTAGQLVRFFMEVSGRCLLHGELDLRGGH